MSTSFGNTRIFLLLCLAVLIASPAAAGDTEGRWGLGLEGGVMKLTEGYWDYSNLDQFGALTYERGLRRHWNLQLALKYGHIRPGAEYRMAEVELDTKSGAPLYNTIWQPMAHLQYRFDPGGFVSPWFGLGLGLTSWKIVDKRGEDAGLFPGGDAIDGYDINGEATTLEGTDFTFAVSLGTDVFFTENLAFRFGGRYYLMPGNETDNAGMSHYWGPGHVDANTAMMEAMVGLTWWFGAADDDRDGVPNDRDACPDQPEDPDGYNDLDGCPDPDNDGDGVPDEADACPRKAEDMDGFQDEDGCPDPDNDGDGVPDGRDRCPNQAEDVDGYQDEDGCPDLDEDGDGIDDERDECPDTPDGVEVDEKGCPVEEEIADQLVLEGVSFRTGSAELTPGSIGTLAEVAASLRAWPDKKIEIRGYTDSSGDAEMNRDLSRRRALSVRDSLIQMGIAPGRITALGFGEDNPVADNGTAEGRARNRRVELHVVD